MQSFHESKLWHRSAEASLKEVHRRLQFKASTPEGLPLLLVRSSAEQIEAPFKESKTEGWKVVKSWVSEMTVESKVGWLLGCFFSNSSRTVQQDKLSPESRYASGQSGTPFSLSERRCSAALTLPCIMSLEPTCCVAQIPALNF